MKKTTIKTAAEQGIANKFGFTGTYVESLIISANKRGYEGATLKTIEKSFDKVRKVEQQKKAAKFNMSLKQYLELQQKAWAILGAFSTGHSMGCYRYLKINGQEFQRRHSLDTYAKSSKWTAKYGQLDLTLTKKEMIALENLEGIWTVQNADGSAKWLESTGSKNSFSVNWVKGFFFGTSHSTKSLRNAKELEVRKRQALVQVMQNDKTFIGVDDVKRIACLPGIKAFCSRHGLNPEMGYNLGFLKSLNDKTADSILQKIQK